MNLTGDAGDELLVGVDALTQVFKEETAMQCSSFQMPPDVTVAVNKVLALVKGWLCMGEKPNCAEFGRNCNYFLFLLSFQGKYEYRDLCSCCRTAAPPA